jgi:hypothetical protein
MRTLDSIPSPTGSIHSRNILPTRTQCALENRSPHDAQPRRGLRSEVSPAPLQLPAVVGSRTLRCCTRAGAPFTGRSIQVPDFSAMPGAVRMVLAGKGGWSLLTSAPCTRLFRPSGSLELPPLRETSRESTSMGESRYTGAARVNSRSCFRWTGSMPDEFGIDGWADSRTMCDARSRSWREARPERNRRGVLGKGSLPLRSAVGAGGTSGSSLRYIRMVRSEGAILPAYRPSSTAFRLTRLPVVCARRTTRLRARANAGRRIWSEASGRSTRSIHTCGVPECLTRWIRVVLHR